MVGYPFLVRLIIKENPKKKESILGSFQRYMFHEVIFNNELHRNNSSRSFFVEYAGGIRVGVHSKLIKRKPNVGRSLTQRIQTLLVKVKGVLGFAYVGRM